MAATKLTLSAEKEVVRKARMLARRRRTSVSAMFSRLVLLMASREGRRPEERLGPVTRKALGMASLPPGKSDRELLEEALMERHGGRR